MLMINSIEKEILFDVLNHPNDTFYENVLSDFLDEQGVEHDFRKPLHNNNFITKLKPYQEKCLEIWVGYWKKIELCTKPTDDDKVEQYFCDLYKQFDLGKPESIIWFNSSIEMLSQAKNKDCNYMWYRLKNKVWSQLGSQIKNLANNHVWNFPRNNMLNQVTSQVTDKLWIEEMMQTWCREVNRVWYCVWYGQQDAHWLAYYAYMMQVLRLEFPKLLIPFMFLAQEVSWWIPVGKIIYATRKLVHNTATQ
jgi:hypothetical protein